MSAEKDEQTGREGAASGSTILMYTTSWCGDCRRAKKMFAALGVPYTEVNIDGEPDAARRVMALNGGMRSVPTILFTDGSMLVEPSSRELEVKLASVQHGR
jgi:mycoredoxin